MMPPRQRDFKQRGLALPAVVMAAFTLSLVIAAMAILTMAESTQSSDQMRGQEALAIAEAGAYRALAELRHRVAVDLDRQIRRPGVSDLRIQSICRSTETPPPDGSVTMVNIITDYAWPPGGASTPEVTDWSRTADTGYLRLGDPDTPIQILTKGSGEVVGSFYALVAVRWSGAPASCRFGAALPDQYLMWFDSAARSSGRTRHATRTVCLRSRSAAPCTTWDWRSTGDFRRWAGSYILSAGTYQGWPVLIERAATLTAPRASGPPAAPSGSDPLYDRPRWEETIER